jgi:tetratricopeptide (TPR) repeat protein
MNIIELRNLIRQPEGPKLDFKREFYAINGRGGDRAWGELIKDIISLANGNVGYANKIGRLIIGPDDKLTASGDRMLHSTQGVIVNVIQIRDKVNSACHPPIANIEFNEFVIDDSRLLVFLITSGPHLYVLTRDIITEKNHYDKGSVLIRVGEQVRIASPDEIDAIRSEKNQLTDKKPSGLDNRINNVQRILNDKNAEYDSVRNKLDQSLGDYSRMEEIMKDMEFLESLIDFLKTKQRMIRTESTVLADDYSPIVHKFFDYAIKLIREKVSKFPLDHGQSNKIINEILEDARDKLELAIDNGYKKPAAYYHLIEIYDNRKEVLSAYEWAKDVADLDHQFVDLCQLCIKIYHTVIDLNPDYKEDALNYIEFERNRLEKILGTSVDDWGRPLDTKL